MRKIEFKNTETKSENDSLILTFEVKCVVKKDWHDKVFNPVFEIGDTGAVVNNYFDAINKKAKI